jgi:predicted transcriptional regulator
MYEGHSYRNFVFSGVNPERSEDNPMSRTHSSNREIVLNIVRSCQPVSRKNVARQSGLHECTVGVIIRQLAREGLLSEKQAKTSRGRPSHMIFVGERCDLSVLDLNLE